MSEGNKGKNLENRIRNWLKQLDIFYERFIDSRSIGGIGASRSADFFVWIKPKLIFIECKQVTASNSLSFKAIRPSQYKAGFKAIKHGFSYILLVELNNSLYGVKMAKFTQHIRLTKKSSINEAEIARIGVLVKNRLRFHKLLLEA